jgi:hypothetical protein
VRHINVLSGVMGKTFVSHVGSVPIAQEDEERSNGGFGQNVGAIFANASATLLAEHDVLGSALGTMDARSHVARILGNSR